MPPTRHQGKRRAVILTCLSALLLVSSESELEILTGIIAAYEVKNSLHAPPGVRGPYDAAHSDDYMDNLLRNTSERRFKIFFRMDRKSFSHLVDLISNDEVFISNGRKPQRPVWYQLAVFLNRFGVTQAEKTAEESSIAEGTVYLYCARVSRAFRRLRPRFLAWPLGQRREQLKARMGELGFPGCIGIVDGSLIRLAVKPLKDGPLYFCRKKYYAIILQAVCDDMLRFTEFDMGWPGNCPDVTVFRDSALWREKGEYFNHDEFILADKGYPLSKFTIRPFAECDLTNDPIENRRRKEFNYRLSSVRIAIEHAFGVLKGRFPALRNMPGTDLIAIYSTVEALMVIHNILIDLKDDPMEIEGLVALDDLPVWQRVHRQATAREINELVGTDLYRTGLYRRKRLMDAMEL